ncbi:NUDIX hydrolase [Numidum massiliense]|uniref:NUDIX hydrolase n=1 Tax=Numidum massiliense TaxID=1522315 RepID=UPI0006D57B3C|nr:NUDIX domain-containing protein [Numidum massiliense]
MRKPYKIAAKAIIFKDDRVLVLRRTEEERTAKEHHGWDFPGGGLEANEPIMDALAREVKEETGLRVKVIAPAYIYDEIQAEKHLVVIKYVCHRPVGTLSLSAEHESAHWFAIDEVAASVLPEWMKEEIARAWHVFKHPPVRNTL